MHDQAIIPFDLAPTDPHSERTGQASVTEKLPGEGGGASFMFKNVAFLCFDAITDYHSTASKQGCRQGGSH